MPSSKMAAVLAAGALAIALAVVGIAEITQTDPAETDTAETDAVTEVTVDGIVVRAPDEYTGGEPVSADEIEDAWRRFRDEYGKGRDLSEQDWADLAAGGWLLIPMDSGPATGRDVPVAPSPR